MGSWAIVDSIGVNLMATYVKMETEQNEQEANLTAIQSSLRVFDALSRMINPQHDIMARACALIMRAEILLPEFGSSIVLPVLESFIDGMLPDMDIYDQCYIRGRICSFRSLSVLIKVD